MCSVPRALVIQTGFFSPTFELIWLDFARFSRSINSGLEFILSFSFQVKDLEFILMSGFYMFFFGRKTA